MSLQKQITEEMSTLAYAIIDYAGKLDAESDVKKFKRLRGMVKAYKDLEGLLKRAAAIEH